MPFEPHVFELIETALAECFQYHSGLDGFLLRCGLAEARLSDIRQRTEAQYKLSGRFQKAPKRIIAQRVLAELGSGNVADDHLVAAIVTALCKGSFPEARREALDAIEGLKTQQAAGRQEKDQKRAEREQKERETTTRQEQAAAERREGRDRLLVAFDQLSILQDPQQRGYALEGFLGDLFAFEGLSPRGSFKIIGEQIDGSFAYSGQTHLVEAKWVKDPVDGSSFGNFAWKIEGKTVDTRGLFVSIHGYSRPAIKALNGKGQLRFVCIDGAHLRRCVQIGWDVAKLLRIIWRHAGETGEAYLPVSSPHFVER